MGTTRFARGLARQDEAGLTTVPGPMRYPQGDGLPTLYLGNKMIVNVRSKHQKYIPQVLAIIFCTAAAGAMKMLISLNFRRPADLPSLRSCDTFALDMAPSPPYPTPFEAFPP